MNRIKFTTAAALILSLSAVFGTSRQIWTQEAKTQYPKIAPISRYLMTDRNADIALARSAAPESISRDAEVLVLGQHGYESAVQGKNGFVCVVERSWMAPFDDPEFLNPDQRLPLLPQSTCRTNPPPTHFQNDGLSIGGTIQD